MIPGIACDFGGNPGHWPPWAEIESQLRRQGHRIEAEDGMIAATALASGMTLVTGNAKHFERVKGLKPIDWENRPPRRRS